MAFDETGNDEGIAEVDRFGGVCGRISRRDGCDAAVPDRNVMSRPAIEACVQEDCVEGHSVAPVVEF